MLKIKIGVAAFSLLLAASLSADQLSKTQLKKYLERNVNPAIAINSVQIAERQKVSVPQGWEKITFVAKVSYMKENKKVSEDGPGIIYSNGRLIASDMYDTTTGLTLSEKTAKRLPDSIYTNESFVAGTKNGKNKVVIFSDPNCTFCKDIVPEILAEASRRPGEFAVYMRHFPIESLHPMSAVIIKSMIVAGERGFNTTQKVYSYNFTAKTVDGTLSEFKKATGLIITKADIAKPSVVKKLNRDKKIADEMFISGTPSIYVNGKLDIGQRELNKI